MTGLAVAMYSLGAGRPAGPIVAAALAALLLAGSLLIWPTRPRGLPSGFDEHPTGRATRQGRGTRVSRLRLLLPGSRGCGHGSGTRGSARRREDSLTNILDCLGPALDAGLPLHASVASVIRSTPADLPERELLRDLHAQAVAGEPLAPVWKRHATVVSSPQLALVAQAWSLSERTGAPLAGAVASTGRLLRDAVAARRRVDSATAQARITVRILAMMPLSGPLLAWAVGVDPPSLLSSPYSRWSVVAGAALFLLGRVWVSRQVAAAMHPHASS